MNSTRTKKSTLVLKSFDDLSWGALTIKGTHRAATDIRSRILHGENGAGPELKPNLALVRCPASGRWTPVTVNLPCPGVE